MATGNCRHDPSRRKRRRSEACNDQVYLGKINDSAGRGRNAGNRDRRRKRARKANYGPPFDSSRLDFDSISDLIEPRLILRQHLTILRLTKVVQNWLKLVLMIKFFK